MYTRNTENDLYAFYSKVRWRFPYILQNVLSNSTQLMTSFHFSLAKQRWIGSYLFFPPVYNQHIITTLLIFYSRIKRILPCLWIPSLCALKNSVPRMTPLPWITPTHIKTPSATSTFNCDHWHLPCHHPTSIFQGPSSRSHLYPSSTCGFPSALLPHLVWIWSLLLCSWWWNQLLPSHQIPELLSSPKFTVPLSCI